MFFFVWDISGKGVGSVPKGKSVEKRDPQGLTYGRCVLIEDNIKNKTGLVLGHELIHSLGHAGHHVLDGGLMHIFKDASGPRIYRDEAETAYANSFN